MKRIYICLTSITIILVLILLYRYTNNTIDKITLVCGNSKNANVEISNKNKSVLYDYKWIIEPGEYETFYFLADDIIASKDKDGKYEIINMMSETIYPNKYDNVFKFSENIAVVNNVQSYTYIDKSGAAVFDDTYQDARSFNEEMAAIKVKNRWGFINLAGNISIECQFEQARSFHEGLAAIQIHNKWGWIDKTGKIVIKPKFDNVDNFYEGIAVVKLNDRYGLISSDGSMLTKIEYDEVSKVYKDAIVAVMKDNKWGFISSDGRMITKIIYDKVEEFHEGYAGVMINNKWGFINRNGEECIPLKYDEVGNFSEGKVAVKLKEYNDEQPQWAYVDKDDNVVIDYYPYDASDGRMVHVGEFKNGLAFVSKTLYCIIDDKGNDVFRGGDSSFFISDLGYNSQLDFIIGYVFVDRYMKIRKYGLLGLDGVCMLEPVFDYIGETNGPYLIVEKIIDGVYRKGIIKIF